MKIIVFNDTRKECHHGCSRVMNSIDVNLKGCFSSIQYIAILEKWKLKESLKREIIQSDLVLINGEGTIHGDAPHVTELLDVLTFAHNYGVRVGVINATIESISAANIKKLKLANFLYVRDVNTYEYLLKNNIHSMVCHDLVFYLTGDIKNLVNNNKFALTDGYGYDFEQIKLPEGFDRVTIFNRNEAYFNSSRIRKLKLMFTNFRKLKTKSAETHIDCLDLLNSYSYIVTGWYQVVCLCIFLGIPFSYTESNTRKITNLLEDIGLVVEKFKFIDFHTPIHFTDEEKLLINLFLKKTQIEINEMFLYIKNN